MLALRGAVCSDRWTEAWGLIQAEQQRQTAARRAQRCTATRAAARATALPTPTAPSAEQQRRRIARLPLGGAQGRPAADHPWRKPFLRRRSAASTSARS